MEPVLLSRLPVGGFLPAPHLARKVVFVIGPELRAAPTGVFEAPAPNGILAPSREGVHVVEGPHCRTGQITEEGTVINKAVHRVEVQDARLRGLLQYRARMRRAIINEELGAFGTSVSVGSKSTSNSSPSEATLQTTPEICGWAEFRYIRILGILGVNKHF
jgi:hypothetical protein